jgi:hypothetical protein
MAKPEKFAHPFGWLTEEQASVKMLYRDGAASPDFKVAQCRRRFT